MVLAALASAAAMLALAPTGAEAAGLRWGFGGAELLTSDAGARSAGVARIEAARGDVVRIPVSWAQIAPVARPAGFDPRDPGDPAYRWAVRSLDDAVRAATTAGLEVVLVVGGAPRWAQGPGRPDDVQPGSWLPDPKAYADFATAVAIRYSGRYAGLPRVRYYQAWNEPNLATYLTPQWNGTAPASPYIYRPLLNAFYDAVKAVDASNVVLSAATAPTGDVPGASRMRPLVFWRTVFCCGGQARLDILAHNPIGGSPRAHAEHRHDIAVPDFRRLRRVVRSGIRSGAVQPPGGKPIWATEMFWDTNPPDSFGISLRKQARWIGLGLYQLWRQRVRTVLLLQARDTLPPTPTPGGYAESYQTGVFFENGKPKPSLRAIRFPFVALRAKRHRVRVWGVAPAAGKVRIQRRVHKRWRTVRVTRARASGVFRSRLALDRVVALRARSRGERSLPFRPGR